MSSYISIDWLPVNPILCWVIVASILHATWQCTLLWLVYKFLSSLSIPNSIHSRFRLAMGMLLFMGAIPLVNGFWMMCRANHPNAILNASQSYVETGQFPLVAISEIQREKDLRRPATFRQEPTESFATSTIPDRPNSTSDSSLSVPKATHQQDLASKASTGASESNGSFQIHWEVILSVSVACIYTLGLVAMFCRVFSALARQWHLVSVVQRTNHRDSIPASIRQTYDGVKKLLGKSLNVRLGAYQGKGVAVVVGVLRPTVLFNISVLTGLTPSQIEQVMIHELAHVYRWDPFTQLLQRLVESLLFFHPLVWKLSREVSELRERCCDDVVVQSYSRIEYAETLLSVLEARPTSTPFALGVTGPSASGIQGRVFALLQETPRISNASSTLVFGVLSTGLLVTSLLCATSLKMPAVAPEPQVGMHSPVVQFFAQTAVPAGGDEPKWIPADLSKVDPYAVMVGGKVLKLQDRKADDLTLSAGVAAGNAKYAQWQFGDFESTSVAVMFVGDSESPRLYLDRNRDRILDATELLAEPKLGKSWVTELEVEVRDIKSQVYRANRQIAITPTSGGTGLRVNTLGFCRGKTNFNGRTVSFRRFDKDGNGIPTDSGDQLCIDLDGNNQLDEFTERFSVRSVLDLGGESYSVFSDRLGHDISLELVKDFGEIDFQFSLADPNADLKSLEGSLRDENGHLVAIRGNDLRVRVPAGRYAIDHLVLVVQDKDDAEWRLTLASSSDQSWFQVQAESQLEIPLLKSLSFRIGPKTELNSDGSRNIQPSLVSINGLSVTEFKCDDPEKSNHWDHGVAAKFTLVAPEVDEQYPDWSNTTCSSGFG